MAPHVTIEKRDDGWYVVVQDSENTVVRTEGQRITVAVTPDDDGTPTPLTVGLEKGA